MPTIWGYSINAADRLRGKRSPCCRCPFIAVVAFHLITLPVELNASSRAVVQMQSLQIVNGEQEITGSRKVLNTAAMTYIAALMISVANLIRILVIRGRRN